MVPCPDCNFDGAAQSMIGWVYAPDNPQANDEGLVKCGTCNGDGFLEGDDE